MSERTGRARRAESPRWSALWLEALGGAGWATRLKRGMAYTREGLLTDLVVGPAQAAATVREPSGPTRQPRLAVRPLTRGEWEMVAAAWLRDSAVAAALRTGDLPASAEAVLAGAGVSLLPEGDDLAADCACGERVPCRHVAALCYALAKALDDDPWLLLLLRGRTRGAVLDALDAARAAMVPEAAGEPPRSARAEDPEGAVPAGGEEARDFGGLAGHGPIVIARPARPAPLLVQLGPPPFWSPPASFARHLTPVYEAVTEGILRLALGEEDSLD